MAVAQRGRDERDLVADRAAKDRSGAEVHAVRGDGASVPHDWHVCGAAVMSAPKSS